jgi:dTDP-D-glucose 4,6-dehydratase
MHPCGQQRQLRQRSMTRYIMTGWEHPLRAFQPNRPGHDRRYAIDYGKARRELGYAPSRNLAQGLRSTLDWYLGNTGWWQPLLGRDYSEWLEKNYKA